jgi:hypothetical protein
VPKSFRLTTLLLMASVAVVPTAQPQHVNAKAPASDSDLEHSAAQMSSHHMESSAHMKMTAVRAMRDGDQVRADQVLEGSRKAVERYRDYRTALADGFIIFLPGLPQKMYHFTNYRYGFEAAFRMNPEHPTSLLYEKQSKGGYKLIGVMYTAPKNATEEELDSRIPLSLAQWHAHVNLCTPPRGQEIALFRAGSRFGLQGSITHKEECERAGGSFKPQVFGWMVHVYPFEKDSAQIWSVERQMEHQHAH